MPLYVPPAVPTPASIGAVPVDAGNIGLGVMAMAIKGTVGTVAAGATIAGSDLRVIYWDGTGMTVTGALSGTWRNIGNSTITNGVGGPAQRIA